jgi:competence protein ComEA
MRSFFVHLTYGLFLGLLAAAVILLAAGRPNSTPVMLLPTPAPSHLTIEIAGEVVKPGVFTLPPGSRVQDAIRAAGGLTSTANPDSLNLAAGLFDGQKILVMAEGQPLILPTDTERSIPIEVSGPIDINTATVEILDTLPGIGPAKAADIISYRQKHGAFDRIEDIQNVSGIGPATFENIRDLITVSGGA